MGERDPRPGDDHAARAVAQGAGAPGEAVVDGGGGGVRLLAHPRPRRRLQPAPPGVSRPPAMSLPPDWIESKAPAAGRRPRRRARLPLRDRPGTRPRCRTGRAGGRAGGTRAAVPRPRRGTRARPGHGVPRSRVSSARSRSLPCGHPERPAALAHFGEAAFECGTLGEAKDALEEAIAAFRAAGDVRGTARATSRLGNVLRRARGSASVDHGRRGAGPARAAATQPGARRDADRDVERGDPAGATRGGARLCRGGALAG